VKKFPVREVGALDVNGMTVRIGVHHDRVTVGLRLAEAWPTLYFDQEHAEEFAQLYVRACWEASAQGGAA
jgi:hypothetical protein